jgi:hypothetical protein
VRTPLQKAGYEPDAVLDDFDIRVKARQYDELSVQAQQQANWENHLAVVAKSYGLPEGDTRLSAATSAEHAIQLAQEAMATDAAKLRETTLKEARAAAVARAEAKVDNGDLDTLGGAPPAGSPSLEERYKKEMLAAKGQGARKGREVREKYRAQGVDVDYIPLR